MDIPWFAVRARSSDVQRTLIFIKIATLTLGAVSKRPEKYVRCSLGGDWRWSGVGRSKFEPSLNETRGAVFLRFSPIDLRDGVEYVANRPRWRSHVNPIAR